MDKIGIRFGNLAVCVVLAIRYENEPVSEETWKKYTKRFLEEDFYVNKGLILPTN